MECNFAVCLGRCTFFVEYFWIKGWRLNLDSIWYYPIKYHKAHIVKINCEFDVQRCKSKSSAGFTQLLMLKRFWLLIIEVDDSNDRLHQITLDSLTSDQEDRIKHYLYLLLLWFNCLIYLIPTRITGSHWQNTHNDNVKVSNYC